MPSSNVNKVALSVVETAADISLPSAVVNFNTLTLEISISPLSLFQTGCVSIQNSPLALGNLLAQAPHSSIFWRDLLNAVVGLSNVTVVG